MATKNVKKDNPSLLNTSRVQFVVGDGRKGYPALGPYKAIHVGAASPVLPQDLVDQLKVSFVFKHKKFVTPGERNSLNFDPFSDLKQSVAQIRMNDEW